MSKLFVRDNIYNDNLDQINRSNQTVFNQKRKAISNVARPDEVVGSNDVSVKNFNYLVDQKYITEKVEDNEDKIVFRVTFIPTPTNNYSIILFIVADQVTVEWGDGEKQDYYGEIFASHSYPSTGPYTIKVDFVKDSFFPVFIVYFADAPGTKFDYKNFTQMFKKQPASNSVANLEFLSLKQNTLQFFGIVYAALDNLDLSGLPNLTNIGIGLCQLQQLDITPCNNLNQIDVNYIEQQLPPVINPFIFEKLFINSPKPNLLNLNLYYNAFTNQSASDLILDLVQYAPTFVDVTGTLNILNQYDYSLTKTNLTGYQQLEAKGWAIL